MSTVIRLTSDVQSLIVSQDLTDTYADFGIAIDCKHYEKIGVWIVSDVNDSENVTLKAFAKNDKSSTNLFEVDGIGEQTLWTTGASDNKKYYTFEVDAVSFIQLQAKAVTVGATAGKLQIYITKS